MEQKHIVIGEKWGWSGQLPIIFDDADREFHLYMTGRSGMGKTTLMQEIMRQDIEAGRGCGILDPHGDVADRVLSYVPSHRVDDVVYIDPTLQKYRTVINPFYKPPEDANVRAVLGYNILAAFKHLWHDSWSDTRMQYILTNIIQALLDAPDELRPTLLGIPIMCINEDYRNAVVKSSRNASVRRFFEHELPSFGKQYMVEAIGPIQNRIGQFLTHPSLRQTFGSWKPTIDFQEVIDNEKILIIRMPKGVFGEEPTNYFGSFTMAGLQAAAMARAHRPEEQRRPFYLNVDEFQNFGTDATAQIFSEARKFKFFLTIAHQYLDQIDEKVLSAIFGNVGSYIAFRVGEEDAKRLAAGIDDFNHNIISNLAKGEIVVQILQNGIPSQMIQGKTFPPADYSRGQEQKIKRLSRQRYCKKTKVVDTQIKKWLRQFEET